MQTKFDFVIIGAGSAGCVLANRLSASGEYSVCLLEAGKDTTSSPLVNIPGAFAGHMFTKKFNWSYDPKPDQRLRHGQPIFTPRGKGLGGSSAINGMLYVRGQPADYDAWEAAGNPGWGYQDMLPYFKKSEHHETLGGDAYHGKGGNLHVSQPGPMYPMSEAFVKASQEAGQRYNNDFNGTDQEGVGYYHLTVKEGRRFSTLSAYLKEAFGRANLTVMTETLTRQIQFDNGSAVAVDVTHKGQPLRLEASREILLCAGAINSPQLLQLSGVGDPEHLRSVGIECQHPLPGVGQNLQEHVDACVLTTSKINNGFTASLMGVLKMTTDLVKYLVGHKGKLAQSITEAGGFIKSSAEVERPDVQLHMLPLLFDDCGRDLKLMARPGYSLHTCVLRPKSRGSVLIRSSDASLAPEIDYRFLTEPEDCKVLVDGIRRVREILAAPAFNGYRNEEIHPGAGSETDEELLAKAKEKIGLVFHPVGTCKMGVDEQAVVTPELKVHGLKALRVVDASVMPTITSGNTNAPTIAIAEKAADLILEAAR